nr:acetylxylan esterase [Candidatus Njordarchaeota archaeon]
ERGPRWSDHGHLETLLVGLSQAGLAVWEHIRALDFLSSLEEVDPNRIGMTGASGGGLYTVYTSAIDERVKVMVPVCYVTSFLPFLKSMRGANWNGGIDLCNQVPNIVSYADMFDIVGLFAPRPLSIITATRDPQFTPEAAKDVFQKAATIYGLYGLKENIALFEVDSVHGYDQKMREAAYGWFMRWLMGKWDGSPIQEPKLTVERPRSPEMRCLRRAIYQGSAITRLVSSLAEKCEYPVPTKRSELIKYQLTLRADLRKLLGDFPPKSDLEVRVTSRGEFTKFDIERVILMSEPGIQVPAFMILPKNLESPESTVLYLDDEKDGCLRNGLAEYFVSKNMGVLGVDVRGTGDTKYAQEFELATDSLMLGRSLIGQRIWDVVRSIDFLHERFPQKRVKIGILGNGVPGLLAILSAALDDRIHFTIANQTPLSFKSLILERQTFPASLFLFDILKFFDLPQIAIALAPRPLAISNPVNGFGYPVFQEQLEREFSCTRSAYEKIEAEDNFSAVAVPVREGKEKLEKWLENRLLLTRREAKVYLGSVSQGETTVTALAKLLDSRGPNAKRVLSKLVEKGLLFSSRTREQRYIPISLPETLTVAKTLLGKELEACLTIPLTEVVKKTRKH